ncbi:PilT/PilU family type 4a pilus ATPase [Candidatus Gottesmanbacteria bacterium]|nr:PilT/PilU family type 4a pilus ATPase [Candidatus Gottesmanbacteria bacterium]
MNIHELIKLAVARKVSDLHLLVSYAPTIRIKGELYSLSATYPPLSSLEIEQMIFSLINPKQKELLVANKELDFSLEINMDDSVVVRFRVNAYYQRGTISASFRIIPFKIPSVEELSLPSILHEFTKLKQGFILITGASGQGKSTTLASIIAQINDNRKVHIVTIEDPIEYCFPPRKAIISQREMYNDTHAWNRALKSALREDPDVVLIGEMRDLETISSALTIAETGHLVFSTLHTNSAAQSIDRIVDVFPAESKKQVQTQLSMVISGIVTQRLVPAISGERVPVCEILTGTPAVRNTIREGKIHLIDNIIQTSHDFGMMLFEEHLSQLVVKNIISPETAMEYAYRPDRYLELSKR